MYANDYGRRNLGDEPHQYRWNCTGCRWVQSNSGTAHTKAILLLHYYGCRQKAMRVE